jgi:uncharacterized protein YehS (DUF1456 family)
MINNDILRRLRYTFDFNDDKMIALFALADYEVTRTEISDWLKKDDDPEWKSLHDKHLAIFLNGFINDRRGKKEGEQPKPEKTLTNNIILRKLKIALNMTDDDMLEILVLANYRLCKDQVLRNFLMGLQLKFKPR